MLLYSLSYYLHRLHPVPLCFVRVGAVAIL